MEEVMIFKEENLRYGEKFKRSKGSIPVKFLRVDQNHVIVEVEFSSRGKGPNKVVSIDKNEFFENYKLISEF